MEDELQSQTPMADAVPFADGAELEASMGCEAAQPALQTPLWHELVKCLHDRRGQL